MRHDLLLFDIGNTSMKVGLASREAVGPSYTLPTDAGQTADSLGLTLHALLGHAGVDAAGLRACLASSVVPGLEPALREACRRYVGRELLFAPRDIPVPLRNDYERPHEVGPDRLVGAFAARRLFPDPESLIVVDFGTAVTFDCITGQTYRGGLIFPGPLTAASALSSRTARLPRVSLEVDCEEPAIGRNTTTSIQHGLIFGFAGMVESLTHRLARQLPGETLVLGTGGFAREMARVTPCLHHVLPGLVLDGLRRLHAECGPSSPENQPSLQGDIA